MAATQPFCRFLRRKLAWRWCHRLPAPFNIASRSARTLRAFGVVSGKANGRFRLAARLSRIGSLRPTRQSPRWKAVPSSAGGSQCGRRAKELSPQPFDHLITCYDRGALSFCFKSRCARPIHSGRRWLIGSSRCRQTSKQEFAAIRLHRDAFHGAWNYSITLARDATVILLQSLSLVPDRGVGFDGNC